MKQWLNTPCDPSEVQQNADGSEFIPIGIVESKLDTLTDFSWSTKNFRFSYIQTDYVLLLSGSLELTVSYDGITRTLVGAATVRQDDMPNNVDYEATIISECTKNAAKKLGPQFGRHLNYRLDIDKGKQTGNNGKLKSPVKVLADDTIKAQYAEAKRLGKANIVELLEKTYDNLKTTTNATEKQDHKR